MPDTDRQNRPNQTPGGPGIPRARLTPWIAIALVGVVGLLGGLYPAIYLSRFLPSRVLKANQSSAVMR